MEFEMPINYLTPTEKNPVFPPALISLFRQHFHDRVLGGGSQEEFLAEYRNFRIIYENYAIQEALNHSNQNEGVPHQQWYQRMKEHVGQVLDEFLILVIGMGQISTGFKLVPTVAAEVPAEVQEPARGKPESRRYVHVLANMIRKNKNSKNPGPHGIPAEAISKVPKPEEMITEMVQAMKNEVEILDYYDTKPYKDHWRGMKDPDFYELATNLLKDMNDIHQGVDYARGFSYADRYHNLIILLRTCKGTTYFMSRPSTYEDVLLNPHMMKLRFADNQKNNAKKKVDNRELAARRAQEYYSIHGCSPPPKERVLKGAAKGRPKRVVPEEDDSNGESPSPAAKTPKKRRVSPMKGKGKAVAPPAATPLNSGGGGPVRDNTFAPSTSSGHFLGVSPLRGDKGLPESYQNWASQQQQQQQYPQLSSQQFQIEAYPTPQQQPLEEQILRYNDRIGTQDYTDKTVGTNIPLLYGSDFDIDNQIATTIYSSLHDESITNDLLNELDVSSFEPLPVTYKSQTPATGYPNSVLNIDPRIVNYGTEAPINEQVFHQQEPTYQSQGLYNGQQYLQMPNPGLQTASQNSGSHQVHHQQANQTYQPQVLSSPEKSFTPISLPNWNINAQTPGSNDVANDKEAFKKNCVTPNIETLSINNFTGGVTASNPVDKGVAYTPCEVFSGQPDFEQDDPLNSPLVERSSFNNISGIGDEAFSEVDWNDTFLFGGPTDDNGNQFFDPYAPIDSTQSRMKDMEMMLERDP